MGGSPSKPAETPLEFILKNWKFFKIDGLEKEKVKKYPNTIWPLYKLGNGKKWPENGSLNYNTILQLDLYCKRFFKNWGKIPHVQCLMAFYQNKGLHKHQI